MRPEYETLLRAVEERLSDYRRSHVLGVCQTAVVLAEIVEVDTESVATAALLHDIAKETPPERLREDLERRGRPIDPEDIDTPSLWHAAAGAAIAEQDFGVDDPDILEAIRLHPTLDAGACRLAQVLFFADFTDPTREWDGVEELRRLARTNFHAALARTLRGKLDHIRSKGREPHPRALRALRQWAPADDTR